MMLDSKQLKPFQCGLCQVKFSQVIVFYQHLHSHEEDLSPYLHVCTGDLLYKEDNDLVASDTKVVDKDNVSETNIDDATCIVLQTPDHVADTDSVPGETLTKVIEDSDNNAQASSDRVDTGSLKIDNEVQDSRLADEMVGAAGINEDSENIIAEKKPLKQVYKGDVTSSVPDKLPCDVDLHLCGVCDYVFPTICLLHYHMKNTHSDAHTCKDTEVGLEKQSYRYDNHTQTAYPENHQRTDNSTQTDLEKSIVKKEKHSAVDSFENTFNHVPMFDDSDDDVTDEVMLDDIDNEGSNNLDSGEKKSMVTKNVENDMFMSSVVVVPISDHMATVKVKEEVTESTSISRKRKRKGRPKKSPVGQQRRSLRSNNKSNRNKHSKSLKSEHDAVSNTDADQTQEDISQANNLWGMETDPLFDMDMEMATYKKKGIVKIPLKSPKLEQCKSCMTLYTPIYLKRHKCKTMYYNKIKDFTEDEEYKKCALCCKVYQKPYYDGHTCRVVTKSTKVQLPAEKTETTMAGSVAEGSRPVYKCKECPAEYPLKNTLRMHVWNRHSKRDLPMCDTCGSSFKRVYQLRDHIAQHHTNNRAFICQVCGKNFVSQTRLNLHNATVHIDENQHTCEICGSSYKTEGNLRNHMRYHKQNYKYTCKYCDKGFIEKSRYMEHFRSHERVECDDTLGKCDECGKIFKADLLEMHKKLVHNEDYGDKTVCTVCDKSILNRMLATHMRTRHGVKIAMRSECPICHKSLAATGLLRHLKVKHLTPKKPKKVKPVKPKLPRGRRPKKVKCEQVDDQQEFLSNPLVETLSNH